MNVSNSYKLIKKNLGISYKLKKEMMSMRKKLKLFLVNFKWLARSSRIQLLGLQLSALNAYI